MNSNTFSSAQTGGNDDASKLSGHLHSAKGNMKEGLGNVTGSTRLQQSGRQEHIAGKSELNAAKGQGYAQGSGNWMEGKKDQVVGAVTGDRSQEASGNMQRARGEVQQDANRIV